jgi:hypothetical protein
MSGCSGQSEVGLYHISRVLGEGMGGTFESICTRRASRSYEPESDNELRPILLHATNKGDVPPRRENHCITRNGSPSEGVTITSAIYNLASASASSCGAISMVGSRKDSEGWNFDGQRDELTSNVEFLV